MAFRNGREVTLQPKPFEALELPRGVDRKRVESALGGVRPKGVGHERFEAGTWSGTFGLLITALTPLHVGIGLFEQRGAQVIKPTIKNGQGFPLLPATTIKGAVRSAAEAISRSCLRIISGDVAEFLEPERRGCAEIHRRKDGSLCPACLIFGALGYQGRVRFGDAVAEPGFTLAVHRILPAYAPNRLARRFRADDGRIRARKVYQYRNPVTLQGGDPYEVVAKGTQFVSRMRVEGLTTAELMLVLTASGLLGLRLKLGGAKQAGLGTIMVQAYEFRPDWEGDDPKTSFTRFVLSSQVLRDKALADWLSARKEDPEAAALIDARALQALTAHWQPSRDARDAPSGAY